MINNKYSKKQFARWTSCECIIFNQLIVANNIAYLSVSPSV